MKNLDDKNLKEKLSFEEYEIKTKSEDIIERFEKEKREETIKVKTPFYLSLAFKILTPVLSLSLLVALFIPMLNGQESGIPPISGDDPVTPGNGNEENPGSPDIGEIHLISELSQEHQNVINQQLNALASFGNVMTPTFDVSSLFNLSQVNTLSISPLDRNSSRVSFDHVIDLYDPFSLGVRNLMLNQDYVTTDTPFTDGSSFLSSYTLVSGEEIITINYNNHQSTDFYITGELVTNEGNYPITIAIEEEYDEKEIETTIYYSENHIVLIEQEHEFEGRETENSFSYAIYTSERDLLREDSYEVEFSFEIETERNETSIEAEVKTKNEQDELELNNIHLVSENELLFEAEYENESYGEFRGNVRNIFNQDGSRTYINLSNNEEITKI